MELEDLDDSWIKEINQDEKIYNKFYTSIPNYVNMYIIYLNDDNSIVHIKTTTTSLNNNVFSKNKLIYYISKYSRFHKKRYSCVDIIKYNIDIDSKEIHDYIQRDIDKSQMYLTQISKTHDIYWKSSVEILHSINSLYIFYKPTNSMLKKTNKTNTKKTRQSNNKKTRKTT
jgi:hypothetical protein